MSSLRIIEDLQDRVDELEEQNKELKECVSIALDYVDSDYLKDKFKAALTERAEK